MCIANASNNCNQSQHFQISHQLRYIGKAYLVSLAVGMVYLLSSYEVFGIWDVVSGIFFFFKKYEDLHLYYMETRSLGALRAPTSSWRPFGPLDFVLRALRALRPCDPRVGDWIVC